MSEKKEKQYAVLYFNGAGDVYRIRWWDARTAARAEAKAFNDRNTGNNAHAVVKQMTRGDGA